MPRYEFQFEGPTDAFLSSQAGIPITGEQAVGTLRKTYFIDDPAKLTRLRNALERIGSGAWRYIGEVP